MVKAEENKKKYEIIDKINSGTFSIPEKLKTKFDKFYKGSDALFSSAYYTILFLGALGIKNNTYYKHTKGEKMMDVIRIDTAAESASLPLIANAFYFQSNFGKKKLKTFEDIFELQPSEIINITQWAAMGALENFFAENPDYATGHPLPRKIEAFLK